MLVAFYSNQRMLLGRVGGVEDIYLHKYRRQISVAITVTGMDYSVRHTSVGCEQIALVLELF